MDRSRLSRRWLPRPAPRDLLLFAGVVASGTVVGLLWRVVVPRAAERSDDAEVSAAVDGSFILLAICAGVATAVLVRRRPGQAPAQRLVGVLIAGWLAGPVAVGMSLLTAGPRPAAWGVSVVWPLTTAVITAAGATYDLLFRTMHEPLASEMLPDDQSRL